MDANWVGVIPYKYIYWVAGAMASVIGAGLGIGGNMAVKTIKKALRTLDFIETELTLQRTNCLTTLQAVAKETRDEQIKTNKELSEQTGYLKAISEHFNK